MFDNTKFFKLTEVLRLQNPTFGYCHRCGMPWNHCEPKSVDTSEKGGTFATCVDCWNESTLDELKEYYTQCYREQEESIKYKEYTMEHTLEHLLSCVENEYIRTHRYYGEAPKLIGKFETDFKEMVHLQYLPVKMANDNRRVLEKRLLPFDELIGMAVANFINTFGAEKYIKSYIYLTVKRKYIEVGSVMNRQGWHSDGFMTDDINYIWYDSSPTIFNLSRFKLTQDDKTSMQEMIEQARIENNVRYNLNTLLRLDQYNIHKVNTNVESGMRTFVKISFSKDKYDLEGNAHNYEIDYDWEMRPRQKERNIPQKI